MKFTIEERIGDPSMFTNRQPELSYFEFFYLKKFEAQDFLELGYKLSNTYETPTNDECLLLAQHWLDGHPAYLRDLFNSKKEENRKLRADLAAQTRKTNKVLGELNQKKGEIGEFWIKSILRNYSQLGCYFAPGDLGNNSEKVRFPRFREIEAQTFTLRGRKIELDLLCKPVQEEGFYLAAEVKNRQVKKVSVDEVELFAEKLQAYREYEQNEIQLQRLYYSFNGFSADAIEKLRYLDIFWGDLEMLDRLS